MQAGSALSPEDDQRTDVSQCNVVHITYRFASVSAVSFPISTDVASNAKRPETPSLRREYTGLGGAAVGSYRRYTGRDADVVMTAARDRVTRVPS
jgi:hypothetical protein